MLPVIVLAYLLLVAGGLTLSCVLWIDRIRTEGRPPRMARLPKRLGWGLLAGAWLLTVLLVERLPHHLRFESWMGDRTLAVRALEGEGVDAPLAMTELLRRLEAGAVEGADAEAVADRALAEMAAIRRIMDDGRKVDWGRVDAGRRAAHMVESLRRQGRVDDARWSRFLALAIVGRLECAREVVAGHPAWCWFQTSAGVSDQVRHHPSEPWRPPGGAPQVRIRGRDAAGKAVEFGPVPVGTAKAPQRLPELPPGEYELETTLRWTGPDLAFDPALIGPGMRAERTAPQPHSVSAPVQLRAKLKVVAPQAWKWQPVEHPPSVAELAKAMQRLGLALCTLPDRRPALVCAPLTHGFPSAFRVKGRWGDEELPEVDLVQAGTQADYGRRPMDLCIPIGAELAARMRSAAASAPVELELRPAPELLLDLPRPTHAHQALPLQVELVVVRGAARAYDPELAAQGDGESLDFSGNRVVRADDQAPVRNVSQMARVTKRQPPQVVWAVRGLPALGALAGLALAVLACFGRRVDGRPHCRACGYDLHGLDLPCACPECGRMIQFARDRRGADRRFTLWPEFWRGAGVLGLGLLVLGWLWLQ